MGGCQSHWLSLRALSRRSRDPLGLAVPGQSFPLRTQANGGLETLEDLLGEIEVELARLAEEEAPPLVVDEELSAAAAAEAANREAVLSAYYGRPHVLWLHLHRAWRMHRVRALCQVLRLERLLASASFSHDELRDNALALATLGWQATGPNPDPNANPNVSPNPNPNPTPNPNVHPNPNPSPNPNPNPRDPWLAAALRTRGSNAATATPAPPAAAAAAARGGGGEGGRAAAAAAAFGVQEG